MDSRYTQPDIPSVVIEFFLSMLLDLVPGWGEGGGRHLQFLPPALLSQPCLNNSSFTKV